MAASGVSDPARLLTQLEPIDEVVPGFVEVEVAVPYLSPAVPETVSVALAELVGEVQEGLLALAVGAGLQVMNAMMEADVTAVCGPKGRQDPARTASRRRLREAPDHGRGAIAA